mgnify:CR=1 FL=1|jgi:hypothetical protein
MFANSILSFLRRNENTKLNRQSEKPVKHLEHSLQPSIVNLQNYNIIRSVNKDAIKHRFA